MIAAFLLLKTLAICKEERRENGQGVVQRRWAPAEFSSRPLIEDKGTSRCEHDGSRCWVNHLKLFLEHFGKGNEFDKSMSYN